MHSGLEVEVKEEGEEREGVRREKALKIWGWDPGLRRQSHVLRG